MFRFIVLLLDLSCLAYPVFEFYSYAIVPCVVNQTHLEYFRGPGSAAIVSHILQFIAVFCRRIKEGAKQRGQEGGMQQRWRSHDLSHSSGGLCKGFWSRYERLEKDMRRPAEVRADPKHR